MTRSEAIRTLKITAAILAVVTIIGYASWRSYSYLRGPEISVLEPVNGTTISSSTASIFGRARRISSLSLNGQPLSVDEDDRFMETVVIFPGLNVLTFYATDQFGRATRSEVRVWGEIAPR